MPAQREDIRVPTGGGEFAAYLATPTAPSGVAVVVLQEIFGVNGFVRGICDVLAEAGHVAIAPDLYWRQAPGIQLDPASEDGRTRAVELMKGLDRDQAVADATAALAAVRAKGLVVHRTAAVGYCFGGGVAYLLAVRNAVDAGIAYYGTNLHTVLGEATNLRGRLLLHIAGKDHLCPPEAQAAISDAIAQLGNRAQAVVHEGAGHAFARRGPTYNAEATERADGLTHDLLASLAAVA